MMNTAYEKTNTEHDFLYFLLCEMWCEQNFPFSGCRMSVQNGSAFCLIMSRLFQLLVEIYVISTSAAKACFIRRISSLVFTSDISTSTM